MKEYSVIFNAEMVRASLDGRKTQDRFPIAWENKSSVTEVHLESRRPFRGIPESHYVNNSVIYTHHPYGLVDDRLWVKEYFAYDPCRECFVYRADNVLKGEPFFYDMRSGSNVYPTDNSLEDENIKWQPPSRMPRKAARIVFVINRVRIEWLQDISLEEIGEEGVVTSGEALLGRKWWVNPIPSIKRSAREDFVRYWDSRHGKKYQYKWEYNPRVWVREIGLVEVLR